MPVTYPTLTIEGAIEPLWFCGVVCQEEHQAMFTESPYVAGVAQWETGTCCEGCGADLKAKRAVYVVAVYDCGQQFGGREEGGWWYDAGSLVRVMRRFRSSKAAYAYSNRLNGKLKSRTWGPNEGKREYTSVLSDGEYRACVFEDTAPQGFPEKRPRYE